MFILDSWIMKKCLSDFLKLAILYLTSLCTNYHIRVYYCFSGMVVCFLFLKSKDYYYNKWVLIDTILCQIKSFIKVGLAFVFGCQTFLSVDFSKFYWLKGLAPKNKGQTNFDERFDLTKKYNYCTHNDFTQKFRLKEWCYY